MVLGAVVVGLAIAVGVDLIRAIRPEPPQKVNVEQNTAPNPFEHRVDLKEPDLARYLTRAPIRKGRPAPGIRITDAARRNLTLPVKGRHSAWILTNVHPDAARVLSAIYEMARANPDRLHATLFLANSQPYVLERMLGSFQTGLTIVWDRRGEYYAQLRAPGPVEFVGARVWLMDPAGRVVDYWQTPDVPEGWETRWRERMELR